jgi:hypothetical protein
MFLLRKLMVLLALEQMVLKCLPHLRSNNNEQALRIPSCKTTARQDSFYPRTIKEWEL